MSMNDGNTPRARTPQSSSAGGVDPNTDLGPGGLEPDADENASGGGVQDQHYKSRLAALCLRMTIYYAVLLLAGWAAVSIFPALIDVLPVGGLSDFTDTTFAQLTTADAQSRINAPTSWQQTVAQLTLAMLSALLLMLPVSWLHSSIHTGDDFDHSIDETVLILPALVAGIVMVVQHSLALAFSLAGIMAGVRFRRALDDTFDTLFIFLAIGVGLAAGVGAIEVAAVMTAFFNYTTVINCIFGNGLESKFAERKEKDRKRKKREKQLEKAEREAQESAVAQEKRADGV